MVDYAGVADARPRKWAGAAEEFQSLSDYALKASKDLREYGSKPLSEHWTDEVGTAAAADFEKLADQLEAARDILLAVNMVADGMTTTIETAHSTLREARELAHRYGMEIGADGTVTGPEVHNRTQAEEMGPYRTQVQALINQALEQVTEADTAAAKEFAKLGAATNVTDPEKALNELQGHASQVQMNMLAGDVPVGESPETVRRWWQGLSPEQRKDMMLAQPVAIAGLNGVPEDVKRELRGTDGKFDRVKMVRYALDNWNKEDPTDFGNNCTNFVSNALHHAGMQEKTSFWEGTTGDDTWMIGNRTGVDEVDKRLAYSDTWGAAENHQNFMLKHGGEEVPRSDVRPGDVIYYEQSGENESIEKGNTHHTAVVTAVMPDGEIKYTQHSDSRQNVSLEGRIDSTEQAEGRQKVRIVRPHPDWY
ncbi:amidase domain-containing protein [Streptomyces marispadix]|uniref:Amidase domain-containing protein n=1 Tax=Streptomyces marispadix TaxID=2922868 RepID=A0ABS9STN4_9ACTN|nr:amidase domain-containing protein [Streptomyces marispadix]MCH6159650.1 amidase domain-containing protein [Streptomyces marispadix]